MRAGALRHKITIQKKGPDDESSGITTIPGDWEDVATVWGSIRPSKSDEDFTADVRYAKMTHKIRIRHLDGLENEMRIVFKNREFNILGIMNMSERNILQDIIAEEQPR